MAEKKVVSRSQFVLPCEQLNLYPVDSAWDVRHNGVTISQIAQAKQSINR